MDKEEILATVTSVFKEILDNEQIVLVRATTAGDIEEWDSLSHIQLVVAIEKKFRIRFTSSQIQSWRNVGEMIDSIGDRIK